MGRPLFVKEYRTISAVDGPLVAVDRVSGVGFNELASLGARNGQVLELDGKRAVIQVFQGTLMRLGAGPVAAGAALVGAESGVPATG